ncbi:c-type cytochrome [Novosphingobium sp. M1R2S20]|uniref:Cytochrome c family protein n=1 Tax=Novosphingobium rhizovicinum TaxID=3228928 RepID=A0ABV3RE93_9SPHN
MRGYFVIALIAFASLVSLAGTARSASPALAQEGKKHFIRCAACHTLSAEARQMSGPHLQGIVGRKAASVKGFAYSQTMKGKTLVWDEAHLDAFLKAPRETHPGMCLTFMGLPRPEDRAALIAYLKTPN